MKCPICDKELDTVLYCINHTVVKMLALEPSEIMHRLECLDVVIFDWIENAEKGSSTQLKLVAISNTLNQLIGEMKKDENIDK
jgi:hypothetical protein